MEGDAGTIQNPNFMNSETKDSDGRNHGEHYNVVALAMSAWQMSFVYFLEVKGHSPDLVVTLVN